MVALLTREVALVVSVGQPSLALKAAPRARVASLVTKAAPRARAMLQISVAQEVLVLLAPLRKLPALQMSVLAEVGVQQRSLLRLAQVGVASAKLANPLG